MRMESARVRFDSSIRTGGANSILSQTDSPFPPTFTPIESPRDWIATWRATARRSI